MTADPDTPMHAAETVPLIVDLDGTLCRTDTLHEGLLSLISSDPKTLLRVPGWLFEGRAGLKARLADQAVLPAEALPLNDEVIALIQTARGEGRQIVLVSAADHRQVTAVAEDTGLFDEAYGSADGTNLKGAEKARFLIERYGENGFDYIGDSTADGPVWDAARRAITVGAGPRVRAVAERADPQARHVAPPDGRERAMLRALRPHQWSKNVLLFLPLLAAHDFSKLVPVLLGFVAFSLTASAVYVLNDLADLSADRAHPRKRNRPFAAGELTAVQGVQMAVGLLFGAIVAAVLTGAPRLLLILAVYFAVTFTYSLWLKRHLILDVLTLAALYTIRIIAGGAASAIDLSPWMLAFSMFLFLALAAVKRQGELTDQMLTGRASKGRAYEVDDLPVLRSLAITSGQAAVLVLALYITSDDVIDLYVYPALLWLICPLLLYWVLRMVMKTHRGEMTDDPILFAATDKMSLVVLLSCLIIAVLASVWPWAVPRI